MGLVAVREDCQGRGLAKRLLAEGERRARQAGFDQMTLHFPYEWRDDMLPFYTARGYTEADVVDLPEKYFDIVQPDKREGFRLRIMSKDLRPAEGAAASTDESP